MKFHQYADDMRNYISSKLENVVPTVNKINVDMKNISQYSVSNGLRLNYDKCKFIVIGTKQKIAQFDKLTIPEISIDNNVISRERNLKKPWSNF